MINPYCIKNRAIGSVYTAHAAQATMHAVYHAMQHMPYYQRFWCKDKIKENIAHIFLAELYFMLLVQT
ncbi:hypothetical protein COM96_18685, partial [Bacillus cereus]